MFLHLYNVARSSPGSMTGLRQAIAKHVVLNILETLNVNDFVNIYIFSETTRELVPCFNDTMVQVNIIMIIIIIIMIIIITKGYRCNNSCNASMTIWSR